ncbi:MAG: TIGR03663 family protein [Spirochaetes bacterium]|nr:TIGR03663 family protein [Spirochaetota bacterium]
MTIDVRRAALFAVLSGVVIIIAVFLRFSSLDARVMHHDEANQAVRFCALFTDGTYVYDPVEHHGPTLYYLSLPAAKLFARNVSSVTEAMLRAVPAFFGVLLVLLTFALAGFSRTAKVITAACAAVSPALVYYSRYFIQEMLLVCFTFGVIVSLWRFLRSPTAFMAAIAGMCFGLMCATKETWVLVTAALIPAVIVVLMMHRHDGMFRSVREYCRMQFIFAGILGVVIPVALFFTSFGTNPTGIFDVFRSVLPYISRSSGSGHAHPWYFYITTLIGNRIGHFYITDVVFMVSGLAGVVLAFAGKIGGREQNAFARFIAVYTLSLALIYSIIPYKTPWCLAGFFHGFILLAGMAAAAVYAGYTSRAARIVMTIAAGTMAFFFGVQSYAAGVLYGADSRNPYAYVHTLPDYLKCMARINQVADTNTFIAVLASATDTWPAPWYLRNYQRVGYWTDTNPDPQILQAPVILVAQEYQPAVHSRLEHTHVLEYYGLRENVFAALYIERGLYKKVIRP